MANETKQEIENIRVHFDVLLTDDQRARFGVYVDDGQSPHAAVMRSLSVLSALDRVTGSVATYEYDATEVEPQPSLSAAVETLEKAIGELREAAILPSELLTGDLVHACADRLESALQQLQGVPETPETRKS